MIIDFSIVFDFLEFSFYESETFLALCFPESTPPCQIIHGRTTMSTDVHTSELSKLFFMTQCSRILHPLIEKYKCFFFLGWWSEANQSTSRCIAREMIGPLCLHGNSIFFEDDAELSACEALPATEILFHDDECLLCMGITDTEKLSSLGKSWKRLAGTE